jgi:UDP-2,3-diacylglucosamine pyrophosphatase LpxH
MELRSCERARTIWISDLHLGLRYSRTRDLLDFLDRYRPSQLYLVGDIVDGWSLKRSWYWSDETNAVLQKLLSLAADGTKVTYIPGNHDAFCRAYCGLEFGNIRIRSQVVHETADGRRLLVLHGDEFDGILRSAPWLYRAGAVAYSAALKLNHWMGAYLNWRGNRYWSLSAFLKSRTKRAIQYINRFEGLVAAEARRHAVDGVVCGHIHSASLQMIGDLVYANTGDWVESCTALIEGPNGLLRIERYGCAPGRPAPSGDGATIARDAHVVAVGDGFSRPDRQSDSPGGQIGDGSPDVRPWRDRLFDMN